MHEGAADPGLYDYAPYRGRPEDRLARRQESRGLGRAQSRILRDRSARCIPQRKAWAAPASRCRRLCHRDHANRVSHWRMADVMTQHGFPGSVSAVGGAVPASSRSGRRCQCARLGVLQPRHLQHPLCLWHGRGAGARDHRGFDPHRARGDRADDPRLARPGADPHAAHARSDRRIWASITPAISITTIRCRR